MNERIKALVEQAGANENTIAVLKQHTYFDPEKFAELILKDVLKYLEGERSQYANPGAYEPQEYYERMDAKENALSDAIGDIKSMYGVKE